MRATYSTVNSPVKNHSAAKNSSPYVACIVDAIEYDRKYAENDAPENDFVKQLSCRCVRLENDPVQPCAPTRKMSVFFRAVRHGVMITDPRRRISFAGPCSCPYTRLPTHGHRYPETRG